MSIIGTCGTNQAKAYANRLADIRVLVIDELGRYDRGPLFNRWRARHPKTKPGGHRNVPYRSLPVEALSLT